MERDSFIMRKKWYEALKDLDAETKAQAFDAICQFALYHTQVEISSPVLKMAMAFIMPDLIADCERWIEGKKAMSEAGKKHKGNQYTRAAAASSAEMEAPSKPSTQMEAPSKPLEAIGSFGTNIFSSCLLNNNISFFSHMCASREEKKEEFLFEIGKEMLRKGAAKPSKEAEAYISYNDSQGWLLKNGRNVSDPVAWAKNWAVKNPSTDIQKGAEAYIMLLTGSMITDRKMLDCFVGFEISGNTIQLKLSSKKAAKAFLSAEEHNLDRMKLAVKMAFPEITNPQLNYLSPK